MQCNIFKELYLYISKSITYETKTIRFGPTISILNTSLIAVHSNICFLQGRSGDREIWGF